MKWFICAANNLLTTYVLVTMYPQPALSAGCRDTLAYQKKAVLGAIRRLNHTDVLQLLPRLMRVSPSLAFTVPCIPPVGAWQYNRLSSGFGWRTHPINGRYKHHQGIDIAGPHQYVRSAAYGRVFRRGYDRGLGLFVVIDHLNSYQTIYGHLAVISCRTGQAVGIGARIGVLGGTGRTTGLHLHYAVKKSGHYVAPNEYMTIGLKIVARYQAALADQVIASTPKKHNW